MFSISSITTSVYLVIVVPFYQSRWNYNLGQFSNTSSTLSLSGRWFLRTARGKGGLALHRLALGSCPLVSMRARKLVEISWTRCCLARATAPLYARSIRSLRCASSSFGSKIPCQQVLRTARSFDRLASHIAFAEVQQHPAFAAPKGATEGKGWLELEGVSRRTNHLAKSSFATWLKLRGRWGPDSWMARTMWSSEVCVVLPSCKFSILRDHVYYIRDLLGRVRKYARSDWDIDEH